MNPYVIIGLMVAWGASLGGAFWFGADYKEGQQAKQEVLLKEAAKEFRRANQEWTDGFALTLSKGLQNIRVTNTTILGEVRHEVETKFVDNPDCRMPVSVVRLLNRSRGYDGGEDGQGTGGTADGVRGAQEAGRVAPDGGGNAR